jgi:hypothetical protein
MAGFEPASAVRLADAMTTRVARWYFFKPKISILGKFWMALK